MSDILPKVAREQKWVDAIARSVDTLRRGVNELDQLREELESLSQELAKIEFVPTAEIHPPQPGEAVTDES